MTCSVRDQFCNEKLRMEQCVNSAAADFGTATVRRGGTAVVSGVLADRRTGST